MLELRVKKIPDCSNEPCAKVETGNRAKNQYLRNNLKNCVIYSPGKLCDAILPPPNRVRFTSRIYAIPLHESAQFSRIPEHH